MHTSNDFCIQIWISKVNHRANYPCDTHIDHDGARRSNARAKLCTGCFDDLNSSSYSPRCVFEVLERTWFECVERGYGVSDRSVFNDNIVHGVVDQISESCNMSVVEGSRVFQHSAVGAKWESGCRDGVQFHKVRNLYLYIYLFV